MAKLKLEEEEEQQLQLQNQTNIKILKLWIFFSEEPLGGIYRHQGTGARGQPLARS